MITEPSAHRPDVTVEFPEGTALTMHVVERDETTSIADLSGLAGFLVGLGWEKRSRTPAGDATLGTLEADDGIVCRVDGTPVAVEEWLSACAVALVDILVDTVQRAQAGRKD